MSIEIVALSFQHAAF